MGSEKMGSDYTKAQDSLLLKAAKLPIVRKPICIINIGYSDLPRSCLEVLRSSEDFQGVGGALRGFEEL